MNDNKKVGYSCMIQPYPTIYYIDEVCNDYTPPSLKTIPIKADAAMNAAACNPFVFLHLQ